MKTPIWVQLREWNVFYEADWGGQQAQLGPETSLLSGPSNSAEFSDGSIIHQEVEEWAARTGIPPLWFPSQQSSY